MVALTTYEMVTVAVYLAGGEHDHVDTEDVAAKSNQLFPGRFVWRKYRDQIDLNSVMIALRHAKRPQNGGLLIGSVEHGWLLTESGRKSALANVDRTGGDAAVPPIDRKTERWAKRERIRLLESDAYQNYLAGGGDSISRGDVERFFGLDEYVGVRNREIRIQRYLKIFGSDAELGSAIAEIAALAKLTDGESAQDG